MTTEPPVANPIAMWDVGQVLSRRWRVLLVCVAVFTALGAVAGRVVPDSYSATTTLVVSPLVANPSMSVSSRDAINIATEREIIQSKDVAQLALEMVGEPPSHDTSLIDNLSVVAPDNSQVLHVTVTDRSPRRAAALSGGVADAYLELRRERGAEVAELFIAQIDERVAELGAEDGLTSEQVRELNDQRRSLALFGQDPGRVIGRATPPASPSGPPDVTFIAAGIVGGMLIGIAAALLRERTDRRVRNSVRLTQTVGSTPVLVSNPDDEEAVRWLRRAIMNDTADPPSTVLLVSAAGTLPTLAGRLAATIERAGRKTSTIDAQTLSTEEIDSARIRVSDTDDDVALIDATGVSSRTTISELADYADAAVVVATPRSLRADAAALFGVAVAASTPAVAVLLSDSEGTQTSRRTNLNDAGATPTPAARQRRGNQ